MTEQELENNIKRYWKVDDLKIIGKYDHEEGKNIAHFVELRNLNGDLLYFPEIKEAGIRPGLAKAATVVSENLEIGQYYQFSARINEKKEFWSRYPLFVERQPFGFPKLDIRERIEAEDHIKNLYKRKGATPDDGKDLANSLKQFQLELYTKPVRFIFELLQNADDFPGSADHLNVSFQALRENVLFSHNGLPFRPVDVEALCSIGDSPKATGTEYTGYKGIGFKSVFTYSTRVYITSGSYRFSFDKEYEAYNSFNRLYPNQINDPFYKDKQDEFVGWENIPWQLKPIWREWYRYPEEVQDNEEWFQSNVGICLEFGQENVDEFEGKIHALFKEPRFMLFLKNIEQIDIQTKKYGEDKINVDRTKGLVKIESNKLIQNFIRFESEKISFDDRKSEFEKIENIPKKITEYAHLSISFAAQVEDHEVLPMEDSVIFTYLPTEDNNYQFKFLINSDFITGSNREQLQPENKWNIFVFEHVGFQVFKWLKHIITNNPEYKSTYLRLLPKPYKKDAAIFKSFNKGFNKGLEELAFLPTVNGEFTTIGQAIYDKTGLFRMVDTGILSHLEKFKGMSLIDPDVQDEEGTLEELDVTTFTSADLKDLLENESVRKKLIGDYDSLCSFLKGISSLPNGQKYLVRLNSVPLIKVEGDSYKEVKKFRRAVPQKYASVFDKLDIASALPVTLEERIDKDDELLKIFADQLKLDTFNVKEAITRLNYSRVNNSLKNSESESFSLDERIKASVLIWNFLFEHRNLQIENQLQVDKRFSNLVIPDQEGRLTELRECKLEQVNFEKNSSSFLYRNFGNKDHNLIDLSQFDFKDQDQEEVRNFFKQIYPDVEITDYRLFKETFDSLINENTVNFHRILESEPDTVVNAGLDLFRFFRKRDDLLDDLTVSISFPVLTTEGIIKQGKEVYLSKTYKKIRPEEDFFAEDIFGGLEGCYLLSPVYLDHIEAEEYDEFFKFLNHLDVKPGFKIYDFYSLSKKLKTNLVIIDESYRNYNQGHNFTSNKTFDVIKDLEKISGKKERVEIFWNKLSDLWKKHDLTGKIITNGQFAHENPFIYQLNRLDLIPNEVGVSTIREIYPPVYKNLIPVKSHFTTLQYNKYPGLSEAVSSFYKEKLEFDDLFEALLAAVKLKHHDYENLIKNHLLNFKLNEEQAEKVKSSIKFKTLGGDFKPVHKLIYVDKSIRKTPLITLSTLKSELKDKTIHHLNMGENGRSLFSSLGVKTIGSENIDCNPITENDFDLGSTKIKSIIEQIVLDDSNDENELQFQKYFDNNQLIKCKRITLSLNNYESFKQEVDYYKDQDKLYFLEIRDLTDTLTQELNISPHESRAIRSELERIMNDHSGNDNGKETLVEEEVIEYEIDYEKIVRGNDLAKDIQIEKNKEAVKKAIIYLDSKGYTINDQTTVKENNSAVEIMGIHHEDRYKRVMVRSAINGILYLHFGTWNELQSEDCELAIMIGGGKHDFLMMKSQNELLELDYNHYNLIRKKNIKDATFINEMVSNDYSDEQGHIIFIANEKGYQSIMETVYKDIERGIDSSEVGKDFGDI